MKLYTNNINWLESRSHKTCAQPFNMMIMEGKGK